MKRLITILVTLFVGCFNVTYGQSNYVTLPSVQNIPLYDPSECTGLKIPSVPFGTPWIVFSDRDNNDVFSGSDLKSSIKKVDLGKRFLVLSEVGNSLEVIEYNQTDFDMVIPKGVFKTKRTGLLQGWISKDKLLLSKECLKVCNIDIPNAPIGFFPLRGLFVQSIGGTLNDVLFAGPGSQVEKNKTDVTTIYGFILKIVTLGGKKYFLMGRNNTIENHLSSEYNILGWKPEADIVFWKHQLSLEFNWKIAAVTERERTNVRAKAWDPNKDGSTPIIPCPVDNYKKDNRGYIIENPVYNQRVPGKYMEYRYPILKVENIPGCTVDRATIGKLNFHGYNNLDSVIKIGTASMKMGQIIGDAIECVNSLIVESQNINLIFVVDATQSMLTGSRRAAVFNSINNAVQKAKDVIIRNGLKNVKLRIGAVVYQDEHISCPDRVVVPIELTDRSVDVTTAIERELNPCGESPADYPEALFYALKTANEKFSKGTKIFQSNYYIVLGDHGSHQRTSDKTWVDFNDLKRMINCTMDEYNIIQHSRENGNNPAKKQAGQLFQTQMTELTKVLSIRNDEEIVTQSFNARYTKQSLKGEGSCFIYPNDEQSLSDTALSLEIERVILNTVPMLDKKIQTLSNLISASNKEVTDVCFYSDLVSFIRSNPNPNADFRPYFGSDDLTREFMKIVIQILKGIRTKDDASGKKYKIEDLKPFFTRHVLLLGKMSGMENPLYNVVISSPKNQMERIDKFISDILPSTGAKLNTRDAIIQAWGKMLVNELKFVKSFQEANLIRLQDAHSLLTGYPGITRYSNLTVGDISSASIFTAKMVDEYIVDWLITRGYIRSVTSGNWAITGPNLLPYIGTINAVRVSNGRTRLLPAQMNTLAARFNVGDIKPTPLYFRNYPRRLTDPQRNIVSYFMETTVFPTESSNFIGTIVNF